MLFIEGGVMKVVLQVASRSAATTWKEVLL
jgi:hypothetical protein